MSASLERCMRKSLVLGLLFIGVAAMAPAQQHNAAVPAAAPPAIHATPAAPIAGGHVALSPAPSQSHSGSHVVSPGMKSGVPHKPAGRPVVQHPPSSSNHTFAARAYNRTFSSCNDSFPAPGFGFDYTHFFAVHPNWGACNPVTGVVLPFGGGGGFYLPVSYYPESSTQPEVSESASNDQSDASRQGSAPEQTTSLSSGSDSYDSSEPVAEYVFVKRDGSAFFAVAYTLLKDRLQYVTKEGLRRSVPLDSIDLDATQKFNEERGNIINLPNLSRPA